ncbi:metallophosphoesterase [Psychroflexus planctonicus]|nr:metallophosphoesterase [Psychroflexus planctonicus]
MRWIIPIFILLLIEVYAFQAFRTLFKFKWSLTIYILVSLTLIAFIIYSFNTPNPNGSFTGLRSFAIGLMLSMAALKISIVFILFGEDLFRFFSALFQKLFTTNSFEIPSRRKFISTLAIGIGSIPFLGLLYGMYKGKYNYKVLTYELEFEDLPASFDGYQITQISDLHCGSFDNNEMVNYGIDLINQQQSDAILFTGDLVNNTAAEMDNWKSSFAKLKAKDGVFSILGNHDYGDYYNWESDREKLNNFNSIKQIQHEMGWKLLLDEAHEINRANEKIAIVGVENWGKGGFKQKGDLDKATANLNENDFKVLMSHDPSHWDAKVKNHPKKFQLTLSGHTHGMQFGIEIPGWFKFSPVQFRYPQWAGIYKEAGQFLNVNRGFGYLAYPGRLGIWPEITVIKLKRKVAV